MQSQVKDKTSRKCAKCGGHLVNDYGEPYCLNCGASQATLFFRDTLDINPAANSSGFHQNTGLGIQRRSHGLKRYDQEA